MLQLLVRQPWAGKCLLWHEHSLTSCSRVRGVCRCPRQPRVIQRRQRQGLLWGEPDSPASHAVAPHTEPATLLSQLHAFRFSFMWAHCNSLSASYANQQEVAFLPWA